MLEGQQGHANLPKMNLFVHNPFYFNVVAYISIFNEIMLGQGLSLAIGNRFVSFQTFEDVDVYFYLLFLVFMV